MEKAKNVESKCPCEVSQGLPVSAPATETAPAPTPAPAPAPPPPPPPPPPPKSAPARARKLIPCPPSGVLTVLCGSPAPLPPPPPPPKSAPVPTRKRSPRPFSGAFTLQCGAAAPLPPPRSFGDPDRFPDLPPYPHPFGHPDPSPASPAPPDLVIPEEGGSLQPQMHRVPPELRQENDPRLYEPKVVSFGPYYHGRVELRFAERFKNKAVEIFVASSDKDEQFFRNKVLETINDAKSYYVGNFKYRYNDSAFAGMMLRDASFIINYMKSPENQIMCNYLGQWGFGQVIRDMLLLENQIPFFILKLLVCLAYGNDEGEQMLNKFLNRNTFLSPKRSGKARSERKPPLHLLAAYRLTFLSEQPEEVKESSPPRYALGECLTKFWHSTRWKQKKDDDNDDDNDDDDDERSFIQSFRSVTDLKAKGIYFQRSPVESLKGFEFKSGYLSARLKVPLSIVSVHTKVIFSNMIAYEMIAQTEIGLEVTAYIEFMKSLIHKPEDVKELREKKILFSYLSSDEDVVKVYKEIGPCGLYYSKTLKDMKKEIQEHYDNKVKTWLAELIHIYFQSPWTVAALLAAAFLLVLTLLQTYYTIKPSS